MPNPSFSALIVSEITGLMLTDGKTWLDRLS